MAGEASWKRRFTPEQLERKRKVDRVGQQKLRRQSKQTTKKLEERLQLASTGEDSSPVQSLLEENARLQKTIHYYRSCLQSVDALVKPCLDADGDGQVDDDLLVADVPRRSFRSRRKESVTRDISSRLRLPRQPSLYYQAKDMLMSDWSFQGADVSVDKLVEAVMLWKLSKNHGLGPKFLEELLELKRPSDQQSVSDCFQQLILSTRFYDHVYEALNGTKELPTAVDVSREGLVKHMKPKELHKRTVFVYVYESLRHWKSSFASLAEWSAIFWSIRLYCEFLTWPTPETLMQVPSHLWPTAAQFSGDHPHFVDHLVWPRIRDFVCSTDQVYDLDELLLALVRNFELRVGSTMPLPPIFQKSAAFTDLQLHPRMFDVLYNLDSFSVRDTFLRQYPGLGTHLSGGTAISSGPTSHYLSQAPNISATEQCLEADVVNVSQVSDTNFGNSPWTSASQSFMSIDGLDKMACGTLGSTATPLPQLREVEGSQTIQDLGHDFESEAVTVDGPVSDWDTTWLVG